MRIAGLVKTSTIDFPSCLSAVIFLQGCNYKCFFCHNRALISTIGDEIDIETVKSFFKKRSGLLDGIVVSGGEATMHNDLGELFSFCRSLGYKTKLDTNGSKPDMVESLLHENLLDYVALDYKAPWNKYKDICGMNADFLQVKKTAELLFNSNINWQMRTTVFPQLSLEDLKQMATEIDRLPLYVLNGYKVPVNYLLSDEALIKAKPYTLSELEIFRHEILKFQPNTVIGTL